MPCVTEYIQFPVYQRQPAKPISGSYWYHRHILTHYVNKTFAVESDGKYRVFQKELYKFESL
jgi:hypothetical protein